ncbi:unnamed protein product [Schistosoma margrebowiei]|uniref:Uncharacterized protein n=1 Tax=Schistosoma margrebowiei TaxID=48269 RepID=A0A183LK16_9TREM|nr:unnamed protein product [Schistosoma margrebowiei]
MKALSSEVKHGIQWTARNQLEDLDFADDLTHQQMKVKINSVAATSLSLYHSLKSEEIDTKLSSKLLNYGGWRYSTGNSDDPKLVLLGTRQQGVPLTLRKLVLPDGFE